MTGDHNTATPHQLELPSYEDYVLGQGILEQIEHIHQFKFTVTYQQTGAIATQAAQDALTAEGYDVLNDLLEAAEIHNLHVLSARASRSKSDLPGDANDPLLEFHFAHDSQHCRFQFYEDRFCIRRTSSSFREFYDWYCNVMPDAFRIEMTLRQIVQRATSRPLRPVQSVHEFVFNFCSFRKPSVRGNSEDEQEARNMDVLAGIIPQLPDHGEMVNLDKQQFYRVDLTVSKHELIGGADRNVWYYIEAPFNRNGRFIVFTAQMRNTSTEILEHGQVVGTNPFDPDFGADYRLALLDFLRDKALDGFASQLLQGWRFSTERNL